MATLDINIWTHSWESEQIPKKLYVLDSKFDKVLKVWLRNSENQRSVDVNAGYYIIKLILPSGEEFKEVVQANEGQVNKVEFDLSRLSPHESHAWAYAQKSIVKTPDSKLVDKRYQGAWIRLWVRKRNKWQIDSLHTLGQSAWYEDAVSYDLNVDEGMHYIQVGGPNIPWRFIALPPYDNLKCLIKPNKGPVKVVHPLEIVITTPNWAAETLLNFLSDHSTSQMEDFYKDSYLNGASAEDLLRSKLKDPTAAAIGAYYLLRMEDFERLHDWSRNLANWVKWMPDGCIIWAWQLIKDGRRSGDVDIREIRKHLLEARKRGLPIYTEGLNLLWEGLKMLYYTDKGDEEVKEAKKWLQKYIEAADLGEPLTTFNGSRPERPNKRSRKGTPSDLSSLKYIYDVELSKHLERMGVKPGEVVTIESDAEDKEFVLEESGKLKSLSGSAAPKYFREIAQYGDLNTRRIEKIDLKGKSI